MAGFGLHPEVSKQAARPGPARGGGWAQTGGDWAATPAVQHILPDVEPPDLGPDRLPTGDPLTDLFGPITDVIDHFFGEPIPLLPERKPAPPPGGVVTDLIDELFGDKTPLPPNKGAPAPVPSGPAPAPFPFGLTPLPFGFPWPF